jgi:hypothetical protein
VVFKRRHLNEKNNKKKIIEDEHRAIKEYKIFGQFRSISKPDLIANNKKKGQVSIV